MSITYKFKTVRLEGGLQVKRPYIDIMLQHGSESMEFAAILDSGSDVTTIPKNVAESLGMTLQGKKEKMITFGGMAKDSYSSSLNLILKSKNRRNDIVLNNVTVGIIDDTAEDDVIIGTTDIFEKLKIIFNDSKSITITKLELN